MDNQMRAEIQKTKEHQDSEIRRIVAWIPCRCDKCIHADYAGYEEGTMYCEKHGCYMTTGGFCHLAEMEGRHE